MKRKYRLLAWLICLGMVLSLAGCGKKEGENGFQTPYQGRSPFKAV